MPTPYRPPRANDFVGSTSGGSSVADLIMRSGQARAEAELRSGDRQADTINTAAQSLQGVIGDYFKRRDDKTVQNAVSAASNVQPKAMPGMDVNGDPAAETGPPDRMAILNGIKDPALRERARQGIQAADTSAINFRKANQDAEAATLKVRQQKDEYIANLAAGVKPFLTNPESAAGALYVAFGHAAEAGISQGEIAQLQEQIQQNPSNIGALVDSLIQRSPTVSKSVFEQRAKTREMKTLNADGSETMEIVEDRPGLTRTGAPKPDTRTLDVQRAEAVARGDAPKAMSLLEQMRQDAEARRDPNVAAARADAANDRKGARADARADRSFQFNSSELERTAKPLTDQAERFGRLVETVNQRTPQADALIAPELLTVMAGGSGSGLRMNEAEISRVLGGRTAYEDLKAKLNKYSLDPSKGLSITDAQRGQIQALIGDMNRRIQTKAGALNEARQALIDADTVEDQRKVMAKLKATLGDTGASDGGAAPTATGPNGQKLVLRNGQWVPQ